MALIGSVTGSVEGSVVKNGAVVISGSTNLSLASDSGEIDITARQGNIDINATAGTIDIDAAGGINLGKAADVAFDIDTAALDIDSSGAVSITTTGAASDISLVTAHTAGVAVLIDANANAGSIVDIDAGILDIDVTGNTTIDAGGTFSVDAVGASNITTNGALTISGSTALNLASDGGEIDLTSRVGAVDVNAATTVDIDGAGGINIGKAADVAIDLDASTLDIDTSDAITIDAGSSSGISIDATAASNFTTTAGALTLAGATLDVDATGGAFNIAGTAASTVTTSGGALNLDGQTGVNIQENGTTVISVDDNRAVTIGQSVTVGSDVAVFISGSTNGSDRTVVGGDIIVSGTLRGGYDSESAATALAVLATSIEISNANGYDNELTEAGQDTFLFVSGGIGKKGVVDGSPGVAVFGGDLVVSGTQYNDTLVASALSGSLTRLADGTSYLAAGSNVTITSGSTGQVVIAASGGGSTDPAGSNTQVQFNDGGSFGADAQLTFNKNTNNLAAQSITVSEYVTGSLFRQYDGEPFNFLGSQLSPSVEVDASDTAFFVSGSKTPAGFSQPAHVQNAVFGGDMVVSGVIRGGYLAAAQTTLLGLRAGLTIIGAGTVPLTTANGGPGQDVGFFVSGSTSTSHVSRVLFGGQVKTSGSILPGVDNSIDLGASTNRWANIYTGDLHLKNDRGDWTVIEEEDYLSLRNNKNGKLYKLLMEEVTE